MPRGRQGFLLSLIHIFAAIQIGIPKQLLAVVVDEEDKNGNPIHYEYALANAKIVSQSVQNAYLKTGEEMCIRDSLPGW